MVLSVGCAGTDDTEEPWDPDAGLRMTFDRFHDVDQVSAWFAALAKKHPRWFRYEVMGRSVQGRPIPCMVIRDHERSQEDVLGAVWVDGAIHGGEIGSQEPALGVVEWFRSAVAEGRPPEWLARTAVHVAPILNPDGVSLAIRSPFLYQRRNLAPVDNDGDGRVDEDGPQDLNGDGYALRMTLPDGRSVLESRDADGDGKYGEDAPGGFDLNRNFPIPAGVVKDIDSNVLLSYTAHTPVVQPETRAVMDHWKRHKELLIALSYHTSANVVVRPKAVNSAAEGVLKDICRRYAEHVDKRAPIVFGVSTLKHLRGTTMEWFMRQGGAVAVTIEMDPLPGAPPDPHRGEPDRIDLGERGVATVARRTGGFGRQNTDRLAEDLERTVDIHVRFIMSVVEMLR